jgi:signal transduction histidine kinase
MGDHTLTRRLGRELLRQAFYISVAVLVSMFAAGKLMEDVLIEQALQSEAEYYWDRVEKDGTRDLPDTMNLTVYRAGIGEGIPGEMTTLEPGLHSWDDPRDAIIYVSERGTDRIVLVFESEQVDELVLLFGIVPLALALIVIYLSTFLAYRVSRRAVSPMVRLAHSVQALDPADPDPQQLLSETDMEADDEIRVLANALEDLVMRIGEFAERERRFTRDASHELRTPLTVIKMAVERLSRDPAVTGSSAETLQRIRSSADDMEHLTKAFLLLARETDRGLAREWISVNDVAETELERARMIADNDQVVTRVEQGNVLLVYAPEQIVESVIGNLLRNAVTYTEEGEVKVTISGDSITIEDTGPGMEPELVEQAFKPFVSRQRQRGGFGVGLTIVRRLTDRFGWKVEVESQPGRGTHVMVRFPNAKTRALP